MEESDEAPTSVTPLSPFMLLSLLGSLASLHLQLRVSGVLELWLGSCNTPLPSHAPSASHRACSHSFPSPAGRRWAPRPTPTSWAWELEGKPGQYTKQRVERPPGEFLCREAGAPTHLDSSRQLQEL